MDRGILTVLAIVISFGSLRAAEIDFVRDVRPILQEHCWTCHGADEQNSGLRLDIKSEAFKGGDGYGPSLIPGNPAESPLIELVTSEDEDLRMPPDGEKLSATEIGTLAEWIRNGAVWPDGVDTATLEDRRNHWSFKPPVDTQEPFVRDESWSGNAVDRFILARLEQEKLTPAPGADPVTWLRRVTLDLTGLPPTPQDVAEFLRHVNEDADAAHAAVVERLLKSPRYGERWAQHWLDVVRYADTHGFEVNTERPNAWPYRDYVIAAFNADTPYDRFIQEQIVGDALEADAATGFLVTASVLLPGQIGQDAPSKRLARQDSLDEIVNNIGQTFLGLSVGCARCHDHKFDPISAKDYYSMQAFVAGVEYADREIRSPAADALRQEMAALQKQVFHIEHKLANFVAIAHPIGISDESRAASGQVPEKRPAVRPTMNIDRFEAIRSKRLRFSILATNRLAPCIDELEVFNAEGQNIAAAGRAPVITTSGDTVVANNHEPRFLNDGEYGNSRSWMSDTMGKGWVELEFPVEHDIVRVAWGRDRTGQYTDRLATDYRIEVADGTEWKLVADSSDRRPGVDDSSEPDAFTTAGLTDEEARQATALLEEKRTLEAKIETARIGQRAFAGTFRKPDEIHLLRRGDPEQPVAPVAPAVLSVIAPLSFPGDTAEQDRRKALADWIASPQNPLTARVMVNRIWQWHFGRGLVETANDFGRNGVEPSHPELLDWLAQEFIRSGWSIKHMHRLIVLSSTYRQSTQHNAAASEIDADIRLLWRYPSRRLEAEAIRDCMLAVSGQLNLKMGGRGFDLFNNRGGLSGFTPVESFSGDGLRRMIYAHKSSSRT